MVDVIKFFTTFLTDNSKKILHKFLLIFGVISIIAFADNMLGFSYYYQNEHKLTQLSLIQQILHDTSYTKEQKQTLSFMRDDILNKQPVLTYFLSSVKNITFINANTNQTIKNNVTSRPSKSQFHF